MTTFAARQHDIWQSVAISLAAHAVVKPNKRLDALAEQAQIIAGAIADYYPCDFQYGNSWEGEERAWQLVPDGVSKLKALSTLGRIRAELTNYTLLGGKLP